MNKTDVGKLLTIASGFDRRQVDEITIQAWHDALRGFEYPECQRAIIEHHRDPLTRQSYMNVGHVLDRVEKGGRARTSDIEADVRSAKARKLIDDLWPAREPLPHDVAVKLNLARERDRRAADDGYAIGDGT